MKFLETITYLGNDALIPINRIKYINMSKNNDGYKIVITGDDGDWSESFKDEKKAYLRYQIIKNIIKAA